MTVRSPLVLGPEFPAEELSHGTGLIAEPDETGDESLDEAGSERGREILMTARWALHACTSRIRSCSGTVGRPRARLMHPVWFWDDHVAIALDPAMIWPTGSDADDCAFCG